MPPQFSIILCDSENEGDTRSKFIILQIHKDERFQIRCITFFQLRWFQSYKVSNLKEQTCVMLNHKLVIFKRICIKVLQCQLLMLELMASSRLNSLISISTQQVTPLYLYADSLSNLLPSKSLQLIDLFPSRSQNYCHINLLCKNFSDGSYAAE